MPSSLPPFKLTPPLLNSSNPWATTKTDLLDLYASPYTGAVTLRTSLLSGFPNDASIHQYTFFSSSSHQASPTPLINIRERNLAPKSNAETCSLNTLGYSPVTFHEYMEILTTMAKDGTLYTAGQSCGNHNKPFIVSVSGSASDIANMLEQIITLVNTPNTDNPYSCDERKEVQLNLMMEINLSCPNIPNKPPPAYDGVALREYITAVWTTKQKIANQNQPWRDIHVGIKTPPYTHAGEFNMLIFALESTSAWSDNARNSLDEEERQDKQHPISFITSCNTLGSCLVLDSSLSPALGSANGSGIGGMAGEALHPLALGNVRTIRGMLDASTCPDVRAIRIIGIGGVSDADGWRRMKSVGAAAIGVGTALGREGVAVFGKIAGGLGEGEFV